MIQPRQSYLVCATPRSGSTLFCEILANTGMAGNPKEFFEYLKGTALPRQPQEYFETLDDETVYEALGRPTLQVDTERLGQWAGTAIADIIAPLAQDVLHTISTKQPFFLSVGFFETHRAFPPPLSTHDALYSAPPSFLPDTPQTRQDMAEFKASAWALDRGIGIVLAALEANGLTDNTLVICTTDHGIAFPGAKATLKDHGTGAMLIMRGPGDFLGGQISDALSHKLTFSRPSAISYRLNNRHGCREARCCH